MGKKKAFEIVVLMANMFQLENKKDALKESDRPTFISFKPGNEYIKARHAFEYLFDGLVESEYMEFATRLQERYSHAHLPLYNMLQNWRPHAHSEETGIPTDQVLLTDFCEILFEVLSSETDFHEPASSDNHLVVSTA